MVPSLSCPLLTKRSPLLLEKNPKGGGGSSCNLLLDHSGAFGMRSPPPTGLSQQGQTAPVVMHDIENTHMLHHLLGCGGVSVHVNLPHMHMLRHVLGWGVGVLAFMLTCRTCTCFVTSWVGGWVGVLAFMRTCRTCTCFVMSWVGGWVC